VPFAFYVAHFFLIHSLSILLGVAQASRLAILGAFIVYPKAMDWTARRLPGLGVVLGSCIRSVRWVAA